MNLSAEHKYLLYAAENWWKNKRPFMWTEQRHIAEPGVNCADIWERGLANRVAMCLRNKHRRKVAWMKSRRKNG